MSTKTQPTGKKHGKIIVNPDDYKPNVPTHIIPKRDEKKVVISIVFEQQIIAGKVEVERHNITCYPHELQDYLIRYKHRDPIIIKNAPKAIGMTDTFELQNS